MTTRPYLPHENLITYRPARDYFIEEKDSRPNSSYIHQLNKFRINYKLFTLRNITNDSSDTDIRNPMSPSGTVRHGFPTDRRIISCLTYAYFCLRGAQLSSPFPLLLSRESIPFCFRLPITPSPSNRSVTCQSLFIKNCWHPKVWTGIKENI